MSRSPLWVVLLVAPACQVGTESGNMLGTGTSTASASSSTTTVADTGNESDATGSSDGGDSSGATGTEGNIWDVGNDDTCLETDPEHPATDCDSLGIVIQPPFDSYYTCANLGVVPGVPMSWGGILVERDDPNTLLIGGDATEATGKLYAVGLARRADCHIVGFDGSPTKEFSDAEWNDGGLSYGPDDVLFYSRFPVNEVGQIVPGELTVARVIDLGAFGMEPSPGGLGFVPPGFAGAGEFKVISSLTGGWYTVTLAPDGMGTFDGVSAQHETTLPGLLEGFVYVSSRNAHFDADSILVAEWFSGRIVAYEIDGQGNPIVATERDFITGLGGAESAHIDAYSGDFAFATYAEDGTDRMVVVEGFLPVEG